MDGMTERDFEILDHAENELFDAARKILPDSDLKALESYALKATDFERIGAAAVAVSRGHWPVKYGDTDLCHSWIDLARILTRVTKMEEERCLNFYLADGATVILTNGPEALVEDLATAWYDSTSVESNVRDGYEIDVMLTDLPAPYVDKALEHVNKHFRLRLKEEIKGGVSRSNMLDDLEAPDHIPLDHTRPVMPDLHMGHTVTVEGDMYDYRFQPLERSGYVRIDVQPCADYLEALSGGRMILPLEEASAILNFLESR